MKLLIQLSLFLLTLAVVSTTLGQDPKPTRVTLEGSPTGDPYLDQVLKIVRTSKVKSLVTKESISPKDKELTFDQFMQQIKRRINADRFKYHVLAEGDSADEVEISISFYREDTFIEQHWAVYHVKNKSTQYIKAQP